MQVCANRAGPGNHRSMFDCRLFLVYATNTMFELINNFFPPRQRIYTIPLAGLA